jgi:tetratricopeptide (TPR) repeat protein
MKKSIVTFVLSLAFLLCVSAAFSQCKEVVWPSNPEIKAKAQESKVAYEDALKAGQLKRAEAHLNWLLANAPKSHSSLYVDGAEIFDKLAAREKDPVRRKVYIDSLMIVYDMRTKNCGDEANVANRKALSYLKYNANENPVEALRLLDKALELNGANIMDGTLMPYMQVLRLNAMRLKNLTDEMILTRYDKISGIVDTKIQNAQKEKKPADKLKKIREDIDVIIFSMIKIDCAFVKKYLEPRFKQNPNDIDLAKKISTFMLKDKCTDDPLWLLAAEAVYNDPNGQKDCGLIKNLSIVYIAKENYTKAEAFLTEAEGLCTESADKAEILQHRRTLEDRKNGKTRD